MKSVNFACFEHLLSVTVIIFLLSPSVTISVSATITSAILCFKMLNDTSNFDIFIEEHRTILLLSLTHLSNIIFQLLLNSYCQQTTVLDAGRTMKLT